MSSVRLELNRQAATEKARRAVEKAYWCKPGERKWLVGVAPDSYSDAGYRTEIHVLEGSGPKGYVLVCGIEFGLGFTVAFGLDGRRLHTWNWREAR